MRKGKEISITVSNHDDAGRDEKEKIPAQDTRRRQQKQLKDDMNEEVAAKREEGNGKNEEVSTMKKEIPTEKVKKRTYNSQVTEKSDSVTKESGNATGSSAGDLTKTKGFRPAGSRRKGKPRRAAGVCE